MSLDEKRQRAKEAHAREQQEARNAEWPEIVPLDVGSDIAPPALPLHVFPSVIRDYVQGATESIDCPADYVAASVVAGAAACIGATARLHVKSKWFEQPSFYICLVGSASQRKSPPMSEVFAPINEEHFLRMETLDRREDDQRRSRRKGASAFGLDGQADEVAKPYRNDEGELIINTATPESFARLFRRQRRGLCLYYEDMTGWLEGMDQYKGGKGDERSMYLKIYDGKSFTVGRRDRTTVVKSSCLTIFGNIQPRVIRPFFQKRDGLAARFLWIYPDARAMKPEDWSEVDPALGERWRAVVSWMLARSLVETDLDSGVVHLEPELFRLADDARERHTEFTRWLCREHAEAEKDSLYSEFLGKTTGLVSRLAVLFRVLREACGEFCHKGIVESRDVNAAAEYCVYAAGMAKRVYGASVTDWRIDPSTRVLEFVRRRAKEGVLAFSRSQAWQAVRGARAMFRKPEDLIAPLKYLQQHNYIRELERGPRGVGRTPTDCYEVHPLVAKGDDA